jgi:sugar/nucleoside kinase (ribokinase family)
MNGPQVLVFGDTFVDMTTHVTAIPELGSASWGTQLVPTPGGSGANMAVTLAHLDCEVRFITCVGDDEAGRFALEVYRSAGIDTTHVAVRHGIATSTCVIMVDKNSERTILVPAQGTASDHLVASDLPRPGVEPVTLLLSGLAIPADDTGRSAEALVAGLPEGSVLYFDPNLRLSPGAVTRPIRERYQKIARRADVLLAGDGEIDVLELRRRPGQVLVRKSGVAGSEITTDERTIHLPARVVDVVNATGAGDAYAATFVAARLRGHSIEESGALATIGGGLAVTYPSAQADFTWRDVLNAHTNDKEHS